MAATWIEVNPFPAVEGDTVYTVRGVWCGSRCETRVIGMARVMWTAALWANLGHDAISWKAAR